MDHGAEAGIGLLVAHGEAAEVFEFLEEILDQVAPSVFHPVDLQRLQAAAPLADHDLRPARPQLFVQPVAVKGAVGEQGAEGEPLQQGQHGAGLEMLPGQEHEADQVAEPVGERHDLGRHGAGGAAYSLTESPPFAPCPERWTRVMVPSIITSSMSGSSDKALKIRSKTPARAQSRKRR